MTALFIMTTADWITAAIGLAGLIFGICSSRKSDKIQKQATKAQQDAANALDKSAIAHEMAAQSIEEANVALKASAEAQKDSAKALDVSAKAQTEIAETQKGLLGTQRELVNTQREVNEMKLKIYLREEEDRKKADLYGEVRKTEPSTYKLIIKNKGRAFATNVSIIFPEDLDKNGISILTDKPIQISSLEPGKSLSYLVALDKNSLQEFRAVFSWDDDFKKGQEKEGSIFINV